MMTDQTAPTPITLLSLSERANQGDPLITAWCNTCQERTIPGARGQCLWCGTRIVREDEDDV